MPSVDVSSNASPRLNFVVRSGKFKGQRYPLFAGMVIGRGEQAHLYLPDFKASRRHARVRAVEEGFELEDLQSHNGTFINGDRMTRAPLVDGDIVHIGSTRLEVIADDNLRTRKDSSTSAPPSEPGTGLVPTIVRRVDLLTPPTLDELPAEDYFTALGIPAPGDARDAGPDVVRRVLTKTRNFAIVYEISKALGAAVNVHELLREAVDFILKVIAAERGYIILRDPESGELVPGVSRRRIGDRTFEDAPFEVSSTIIDWVIKERSAVVSSDASTDQRFQEKQSIVLYNIRSVLCAPMMHGDNAIGVIQLDSVGSGVGFTEDDLELISVIAPVLGVAVENTRLIEAQERTIAELREAHQKLVAAQEQLVSKEKMANVGRITSGLAHEIRNLMGPFMLADLLQAEYPDDENIRDYATLMLEAYGRIGSLVEEIRMLAKGEQAELVLMEHDIRSTIESVVRFVKCDQEVRSHRMIIAADELPKLVYDENRIKQVLINLIRNAVQSMDKPGDVEVAAARDPVKPDTIRIVVADQGSGISAEVIERIWEPFFSTKAHAGTGLGLDVCRGIVERHGGTITCESVVGQGTQMIVRLPMVTSAEERG